MVAVASFRFASCTRIVILHITWSCNSYAYFSSKPVDPMQESVVHVRLLPVESPVQAVPDSGRALGSSSGRAKWADKEVDRSTEQSDQTDTAVDRSTELAELAELAALAALAAPLQVHPAPPTRSRTPDMHDLARASPRFSSYHASAGNPSSDGKSLHRSHTSHLPG